MKKKNIAILGSTGSIGTQTLDIISHFPDRFCVEILTANTNADLLIEQAKKFEPNAVVIVDKTKYEYVKQALNNTYIKVFAGYKALEEVVCFKDVDIVLQALVGFAGLKPTAEAIKSKKIIALANKETMVVAGEYITRLAAENNVPILPVDSEHSAIFQCIQGEWQNKIEKIWLTASGGAFWGKNIEELKNIKPEDALRNPNWIMGQKVTIDSATLMNKGLEVIEAKWLFNVDVQKVVPIIHRQSIIHSMVEFEDGSIKAQMALPDMHLPILYALSYPQRPKFNSKKLDLFAINNLTFEQPNRKIFRCLDLSFSAIKQGGNMPCIMNAANEVAVKKFLEQKISFLQIADVIEKAMQKSNFIKNPTFEDYFLTDKEVKEQVEKEY